MQYPRFPIVKPHFASQLLWRIIKCVNCCIHGMTVSGFWSVCMKGTEVLTHSMNQELLCYERKNACIIITFILPVHHEEGSLRVPWHRNRTPPTHDPPTINNWQSTSLPDLSRHMTLHTKAL